jgi:hypothetical protein
MNYTNGGVECRSRKYEKICFFPAAALPASGSKGIFSA